jgi:hypothetical protein
VTASIGRHSLEEPGRDVYQIETLKCDGSILLPQKIETTAVYNQALAIALYAAEPVSLFG